MPTKSLLALAFGLVSAVFDSASAQPEWNRDKRLESLRGLSAVQVRAGLGTIDAYPDDPSERQIQEWIEKNLRKYGITVLPKTEEPNDSPRLTVNVDFMNFGILYYHFGISVELWQPVKLERSAQRINAVTWLYGGPPGGIIGGYSKESQIMEVVNNFICDYRAANPSVKGPMPTCNDEVRRDDLVQHYERNKGMTKRDEQVIRASALFDLEEVKALLDKGASVEAQDPAGWTPLLYAVRLNTHESKQNALVKLLLDRGANPNVSANCRWTPLILAIQSQNLVMVKELLAHGADVNTATREGFTPLMAASVVGFTDAVQLLIRHGADVNAKAHDGSTALTLVKTHRNRISPFDRAAAISAPYQNSTKQENEMLEKARRQHDEILQMLTAAGAKQ